LFANKLTIPTVKLLSTERLKLDLVTNRGLLASVTVAFNRAVNEAKIKEHTQTDIVGLHTKDLISMNSTKFLAIGYINVEKIKNSYVGVEDLTLKVTFGDHLTSEFLLKKTQEMKQLNSLTSWLRQEHVCLEKQFMETGVNELASVFEKIFETPREIITTTFFREHAFNRITSGGKFQCKQATNNKVQAVLQKTGTVLINFNCIDLKLFGTFSAPQIDGHGEIKQLGTRNMFSTKEAVEKVNNAVTLENPECTQMEVNSLRNVTVAKYSPTVKIIRDVCSVKNVRKRRLGKSKNADTKTNKKIESFVAADQDNYGIRLCMFF
jgi:hypothetical protein